MALVVLAIRWHSLLLIRRLRGASRLTCADLTSPGYRISCLWYRFAVTELGPGETGLGRPVP